MKKSLILLIAGMLLSLTYIKAQEATLDNILSSYFKAIGTEKMKDWQTITSTGKSVFGGQEFPFVLIQKRPGKMRIEAEVQKMKMIQTFDGEKGWSVMPWTGSTDPQEMTADQAKEMKRQSDPEGQLYKWKEKGSKAELIGKEEMEGTTAYKIRLTLADGDVQDMFIDAESYVPLKIAAKTKVQGNETEGEAYFSNYK
ncbi:MAG: hypothetical protein WCL00_05530, partial [Bacteroidota bacterium]